jgi:hypothetical protein
MNLLTKDMMPELLSVNEGTCISLYMPTHRTHPDNLKIRYSLRNLLKNLKQLTSKTFRVRGYNTTRTICSTWKWWRVLENTSDGLAVLGTIDMFKTISLPVAIEELTVVSNSFHTKPLRRYLQSVERYNVLGLSLHDYQIYEGNRHSLSQNWSFLQIFPENINEALGYDLTDKHTTPYGGESQTGGMHHGHGGKSLKKI